MCASILPLGFSLVISLLIRVLAKALIDTYMIHETEGTLNEVLWSQSAWVF